MNKALVIYGPTATGKTALALQLARKFQGELISADSRQVYKGLDIGTGKVSFESKTEKHDGYWIVDGVKINGFDLVNPQESFSAADFLEFAKQSIAKIEKSKKLPIIVGGSGFYIKTLIDGLGTQGIPANKSLRKKLESLDKAELYEYLLKINNSKAKTMNVSDRLNPRRLIRAIEISIYKASTSEESEPTSEVNTSYQPLTTNYQLIGLNAPNDYLYKRADAWLDERIKKGMIGEVESLLKGKISPNWLEGLGLEYRWLTQYLTGQVKKDQAVERLRGDIHSYIRRQKTWFKKFKDIAIYDISRPYWAQELEKKVELWYNSHSLGTFA